MRVLFVAYCMVNNENGDSLIGVYKRSIRIGLEMVRRGHEVWMFCTGRERFHDELTKEAEAHFQFLDFPGLLMLSRSIEARRRYYRMAFRRLKPDLVVGGEAPLAGPILEATLCAVSLGIRVVALDNAYSPKTARHFVASHGPMLDGVVLTGPSSFHMKDPPAYYCPVPPYIEGSSVEAEALMDQLGLRQKRLITVLGYERKAEQLAAAILPKLAKLDCSAVFLTPKPRDSQERLNVLPAKVLKNIRVLPLPGENLLFGLLKISDLVIGKCGFMQVSECLALRTPFLGIHYRGCFPLSFLSSDMERFVYGTNRAKASKKTIEAAVRLLHTAPDELCKVHDGRFGARSAVADFLERLPPVPRPETTEECSNLGYPASVFLDVLSNRHPKVSVCIEAVRCTRLRDMDWGHIDSLVCSYTEGFRRRSIFLWGRKYHSRSAASKDIRAAALPSSGRRVLFVSQDGRAMLEEDAGEWLLPTISLGAALFKDGSLAALRDMFFSWPGRLRFFLGRPALDNRQPARTKGQNDAIQM
jgi:UDP-N-acetylglucosamine:LPS N-acetylglucosamine transferase